VNHYIAGWQCDGRTELLSVVVGW